MRRPLAAVLYRQAGHATELVGETDLEVDLAELLYPEIGLVIGITITRITRRIREA